LTQKEPKKSRLMKKSNSSPPFLRRGKDELPPGSLSRGGLIKDE